ncbi:MAG: M20/M25/M40 family metallo-hydrolase [Bacteroidota bacterium]
MKKISFSLILVTWSASFLMAQADMDKALKSITAVDLIKTVNYLASKELKGRLPGDIGYMLAAEYAAGKFQALGLEPFGDSAYYQFFDTEMNLITGPCVLEKVSDQGNNKSYILGVHYVCRGFTGSGDITAEIVFCGYGLTQGNYDDYAGIDVGGKIVMIIKQNPPWKPDGGEWLQNDMREKADNAYQHGAKAVFLISRPNDEHPQMTIGSVMAGEGPHHADLPQIHIDLPVAEEILAVKNKSPQQMQALIDSLKQPQSFSTGVNFHIEVKAGYKEKVRTMNVMGMIRGADEKLKNEYVVLSAHLDHVGEQAGEIYFPGANDNASGSAAVMEIAEAYIAGKIQPARSLVFVLFACEESGLDGSTWCAEHFPGGIDNITALMNMDCVAFGDSIMLGSGKTSPELWKLAKEQDSLYTKMAIGRTWGGGGADATPFYEKGVPTLYFVTTNSYAHLHYMTDLPETLNLPLFESITKLAFLTSFKVATGMYTREKTAKPE